MKPTLGVLLISFVIAALFQNCGDVRLTPTTNNVLSVSPDLPKGTFCSESGSEFAANAKFIFITDMSLSNLGNGAPDVTNCCSGDNRVPWYLGSQRTGAQISGLTIASDPHGQRFQVINQFVSQCGAQANFQYAVYGFGDNVVFAGNNESCTSPFFASNQVSSHVSALKAIQEKDLQIAGTYGAYSDPTVSPFTMGGKTSYSSSLSCLKARIERDAPLNMADSPIYQVFFLTDGKPTDLNPNYEATLSDLATYARTAGSQLRFLPIYYGIPAERELALFNLDKMAKAVDPLASAQQISDFNGLANQLCQSFAPQARIGYQVTSAWAVNLSKSFRSGTHEPDSDLDGVIDREDEHPTLPRSEGGILDRLCQDLKKSGLTCTKPILADGSDCETQFVGFGLNRCDIEISSQIYGLPLNGFDTDKDGIPDYIEIVSGLNPATADLLHADRDGDHVSDREEVARGSNPDIADASFSSNNWLAWELSESSPSATSCNVGGLPYQFSLTNIPLSHTQRFSGRLGAMGVNLEADENLVVVMTIQQPLGRASGQARLTVELISTGLKSGARIDKMISIGDLPK